MGQESSAMAALWRSAGGETWVALQPLMDRMNRPVWEAVADRLAVRPGERALDVGCGAGDTTLDLADRVGPAGEAVGIDISPPLLAAARSAGAGLGHLRFVEADAQAHPFEPASFDVVASRFGVMFFADPDAAFANLRRAIRPGGRLAFACWRSAADNPMSLLPLKAAAPYLPPRPPADPDAPGRFAFADPDRVHGILARSGWRDIVIEAFDVDTPVDFDEAMALSVRLGSLAPVLRDQPESVRDRVEAAVAEALRGEVVGGVVPMTAACWLVTAGA